MTGMGREKAVQPGNWHAETMTPIDDDAAAPGDIVIVDDSESMLALFRELVRNNLPDCRVHTFANPIEGLRWCLANETELIIVDYVMPELNGLSFIEAFRKDSSRNDVPVVMVTSDEHRETRYMALQLGASDFLGKPVDEIEFVTRVRNLLALSRSHRTLSNRARWLADEVRTATASLMDREREAILILSRAAEYRDNETGAHLLRMAEYSRLIAEGLGLDAEDVDLVHTAAPMHDIGKIGIPDRILLKPDRLDRHEYEIMQQHPAIGYGILSHSSAPLLKTAAQIALHHHEKYDGSGYPYRLAGEAIPLAGRIVAAADVFDALTSARPYKRAWPLEMARAYLIDERGRHFDPACVDVLLSRWHEVCRIAETRRDAPDCGGRIISCRRERPR